MSAHTPGPYVVRKRGHHYSSHEIVTEKAQKAAIPLAWVAKLNNGDANAHLFAAAPDLLKVAHRWLRLMHKAGAGACVCDAAKSYVCCRCEVTAAIARAEGKR